VKAGLKITLMGEAPSSLATAARDQDENKNSLEMCRAEVEV
jgi:hypothetical protein